MSPAVRRTYGFQLSGPSWVTINGFTVTRTEGSAIYLTSSSNNVMITNSTVTFANDYGIHVLGGSGMLIGSNVFSDNNDHRIALTAGVTGSTVQDNELFRNARLRCGPPTASISMVRPAISFSAIVSTTTKAPDCRYNLPRITTSF